MKVVLMSRGGVAEVAMVAYGVTWRDLQNLFDMYPRLASRFYRSLAVSLSQRLRAHISRRWLASGWKLPSFHVAP